jgi:hypothetical protein
MSLIERFTSDVACAPAGLRARPPSRLLAAVAIAISIVAATPAFAEGKRSRTIAPGTIAGPIIGGVAANNGYYAYGPYTWPSWAGILPQNPLYGPAVPMQPGCFVQRQRIWTEYGWRWREAPICY